MSRESKQERREMRDRFAMAAMQSIIRNYTVFDEDGFSQSRDPEAGVFTSIGGEAYFEGWRKDNKYGYPPGDILADEAYAIAESMMRQRDHENSKEDEKEKQQCAKVSDNEKTTEESKSTANQSGRGNDGSRVLEVSAGEPAAGESQVGSDQQACSERLQESQPER